MSKTPEGRIKLDTHATGGCVVEINEADAVVVRDQMTEWLG